MNLLELLDKLSPDDRQAVIDQVTAQLLGKSPGEPLILRWTAKVSTLGDAEEMLKEISEASGIPTEYLQEQDIRGKFEEIQRQSAESELLIEAYKLFLKKNNAKSDKYEEAYDLAKFLISLPVKYTLEIPYNVVAVPDFIVTDGHKRIGIEHTRIVHTDSKVLVKETVKILEKTAQLMLQKDNTLKQLINISINYQQLMVGQKSIVSGRFSVAEKLIVAQTLASYLEGVLSQDPGVVRPAFVDRVSVSDKSVHPLNIVLNEHYVAKPEFDELLKKSVTAKEKKIAAYSMDTTLSDLWLLIIVSGVTAPSSYVLGKETVSMEIASQFGKIFLFDNFSHELQEIYSNNNSLINLIDYQHYNIHFA